MLRNPWKRCCSRRSGPTLLSSSFTSLFHSGTCVEGNPERRSGIEEDPSLQISHPWPEWVQLIKWLLHKGHFLHDEGNVFRNTALGAKDCNAIRTACLNFGRDHFHILRFLSQKDIGVTVALGCPSLDRKVVNSGKRLRAYVGIDEGNVCSSCNLRGDCERAFVKAREDEGGRTVDVMRIILTYGLDPITGSVDNKPCLTKRVEDSVRRLLKEIVEHSTKEENSNFPDSTEVVTGQVHSNQPGKDKIDVAMMKKGDWLCPKCDFMNFARNIRCLRCDCLFEEKIRQLKQYNDHLPLKKGDWICNICNFLNFAKNTRCLQCKERASNRHLNPGEWECDSCNYINFRRNMVCLKCDHRRPIVSRASNSSLQPQQEDINHHKIGKFGSGAHQGDSSGETKLVSKRKNRKKDSHVWRFVEDNSENHKLDRSGETKLVFERKNRKNDSHMWRFVEDKSENHKLVNESIDPSEFIDFPIVGGKTQLSEVQRREAHKTELPNQRRPPWQSETDDDEFCSSDNHSTDDEFCSANHQSADDEEMDEWFGKGKIGR